MSFLFKVTLALSQVSSDKGSLANKRLGGAAVYIARTLCLRKPTKEAKTPPQVSSPEPIMSVNLLI